MNRLACVLAAGAVLVLLHLPEVRAAEPAPGDATAIQQQAIALYRAGRYEEAAQYYQHLASLQPNQVDVLKDLMWVWWRAGRFERTASVAEQITARAHNDTEAWNALGQAKLALEQPSEAVKAFMQSVRIAPEQTALWLTIIRLHLDLEHVRPAMDLIDRVRALHPDLPDLYPLLARAQMLQGQYAAAAASWAKAAAAFPDRPTYRHQEAMALYQNGQEEQAIAILREVATSHPAYRPSTNFLVDMATAQGDLESAAKLLERQLATPAPGDEQPLLILANLYRRIGRNDRYVATLDRCLELNPAQGEAMLQKAEQFQRDDRLAEAATLYRRVLKANPWSFRGITGLADTQYSRGHYTDAIELIQQARRMDPANPYLLHNQARYLYGYGKVAESKRLLLHWLEHNPQEPVLRVLVYHGLVESPDDPLLASKVHMTVETFEAQIRALHDAGFTPVTMDEVAAWYHGTGSLPERPILLTFDDARMDSFERADPILARYHFKATMFVPLSNVTPSLPGYASWGTIKHYQQTGRWEIQSHGGYASNYIQIDPEGRKGLFLMNRQWLPQEHRMERPEEWERRIADDYRLSYDEIVRHVGTTPVAMAYPESNFGQEGIPNVAGAAPRNLEHVRKHFTLVFRQDTYGLNVRSDDPALLRRLEPDRAWSGADLVRHLTVNTPFVFAHITLLRQAAWQGQLREARHWLAQLQRDEVPESIALIEQGRIYYAIGDPHHGRILVQQALLTDQTPEVVEAAEVLRSGTGDTRWPWTPSAMFHQDNRGRQHAVVDQALGAWETGAMTWRVRERSGWFHESGVPDILMHGGGLGTTVNLGLFHQLDAEALGLWLNGGAGTMVHAAGSLHSRWLDGLTTDVEGGDVPVETARALQAGIQNRYVGLRTDLGGSGLWRASLAGRAASLSDSNERLTASAELSRGVKWPWLRLLYRFTADNTTQVSPDYYSPQRLLLHQFGPEVHRQLWRWLGISIRYLPGFATEQGTAGTFAHTLEVETPIQRKGITWLRPVFFLSRTPTYESHEAGVMLRLNF